MKIILLEFKLISLRFFKNLNLNDLQILMKILIL